MDNTRSGGCKMSPLSRLRPLALLCLMNREVSPDSRTINKLGSAPFTFLPRPLQIQEVSSEAHGMECGAGRGGSSPPPPLPSQSPGHEPTLIKRTSWSLQIQGLPAAKSP